MPDDPSPDSEATLVAPIDEAAFAEEAAGNGPAANISVTAKPDAKGASANSTDAKPVTKPSDADATAAKPSDPIATAAKPSDPIATAAKPSDDPPVAKPSDANAAAKSSDANAAAKSSDANAAAKSSETNATASKSTDDQPVAKPIDANATAAKLEAINARAKAIGAKFVEATGKSADNATTVNAAGVIDNATTGDSNSDHVDTNASTSGGRRDRDSDGTTGSLPGYDITGLIGRGGMGDVVLGLDNEVGREVAIKRLRGTQTSADSIARFLREAKIQARLEHPAIIPVHSIGRDDEDQPYFTMKRITGVTLADVLAKHERDQPPRQKILRALIDVCRCIDLAHSKKVVHRDLKPLNIMFGDYGEVYVLDWGLARVIDEEEDTRKTMSFGVVSLDGATQAGVMLGTPGYMPPEQMEDAHTVGLPADIYPLGAILFEVLAGEPVHRKGELLASTMAGTDVSPAQRRLDREVPPELDTLCVAALAREPKARPTAREMADRLEGFLDGDRDLEARHRIAKRALDEARRAVMSADPSRRAEAVKAAGRALALDPESRGAADLITSLMLVPPRNHPVALRQQLITAETQVQKRQGRVALGSFAAVLVFLALSAVNGLKDWPLFALIVGWTVMLSFIAFQVSRREVTRREIGFVALGNACLVALLSRMFGSLLIAPAVTCIMALSLTSYPQNIDRARFVISALVLSWIAPVILEWTGILEPTWRVVDGAIISTSSMVEIGGNETVWLMVFANVMTIIVFGLFANKLARSRRDAQRQVEVQAWHLRQLLPT